MLSTVNSEELFYEFAPLLVGAGKALLSGGRRVLGNVAPKTGEFIQGQRSAWNSLTPETKNMFAWTVAPEAAIAAGGAMSPKSNSDGTKGNESLENGSIENSSKEITSTSDNNLMNTITDHPWASAGVLGGILGAGALSKAILSRKNNQKI